MALEPAGVVLQAQGYDEYIRKLREISKAQKEAFSGEFKEYQEGLKKIGDAYKNLPKSVPKELPLPKPDQAKQLEEALALVGKTGKFAISQISEETLRLNAALNTLRKSGQFQIQALQPQVIKSDKLKELTRNLDESLQAGNGFNRFINSAVGNVGDLTGMLGGLIGKFTLVATAIKVVNDVIQFFSGALAVAQRNETLSVSLQEIGASAGYSSKQIDLATKLLNKQGITTQAAQQSLLRMARANISWAEASKLAAIAQGSAVIAGMNSSAAFERLVTGIQKMEPELLDELGITLRRQDAYDRFAQTVNKNSKQLTDAEKQQAILNEIYRQSESVIGVYGAAMETAGKKQASLDRLIEETQNNLGKLALPLKNISVDMQTEFWKGLQLATAGLSGWSEVLEKVLYQLEQFNLKSKLPDDVKAGYRQLERIFMSSGSSAEEASSKADKLISTLQDGEDVKVSDLTKQFEAMGLSQGEAFAQAQKVSKELDKIKDSAQGIENTNNALKGFLGPLGLLVDMIPGVEISFEQLGKGSMRWLQIFVDSIALAKAAWVTFVHEFQVSSAKISQIGTDIKNLDWGKAWENTTKLAESRTDDFAANFQKVAQFMLEDARKQFPEVYKSWDEAIGNVEGSSEDLRLAQEDQGEATEDATKAIEEQIAALEALKDGYKSVQNIQEKTQEQQAKAWEDYQEGLVKAEEKYLKNREKKIAEFNKQMVEFEAENARKRQKMLEEFEIQQQNRLREFTLQRRQAESDYNLKVRQDKRKFYEDQKKALRDFQLSQMQAQRQFSISDRRLQAEGDVLALMEAREDFAVQQKENQENFRNQQVSAKENFQEQQKTAAENFKQQEEQARQSFALQTDIQREEFQRRLAEFDENLSLERQKRIEANQLALEEMATAYEEEKAQLLQNYEDKMKSILEQRDKELKALGDSLKEQGELTEEGMKEIADLVAEVFGDDAAGDKLIEGWAERSQNTLSSAIDAMNAKIKELKAAMDDSGAAPTSSKFTPGASAGFGANPSTLSYPTPKKPIGARSGFNGIVTGPQTFQIEPGVREHVAITPLPRFGGSVKVGGSVGVNVTGLSAGAGAGVEEQVANVLLEEIKIAVKTLSRRIG